MNLKTKIVEILSRLGFIALFLFIFSNFVLYNAEQIHEVISGTMDVSFILFGFLLTVFSIVIQSGKKIRKKYFIPN